MRRYSANTCVAHAGACKSSAEQAGERMKFPGWVCLPLGCGHVGVNTWITWGHVGGRPVGPRGGWKIAKPPAEDIYSIARHSESWPSC
eukprot:8537938-Alexandrium_andersonii.AAC.1